MGKTSRYRLALTLASAAAAPLLFAAVSLAPQKAAAKPQFTAQTKLPCGNCHLSPSGGALNPFGEKFKANGNKLPDK